MARRVVFLDACVLYAPLVRALVLEAAAAGLLTPRWSPRVLAEWRIAAARRGGLEAEDRVAEAVARMQARFPAAPVMPDPVIPNPVIPNPVRPGAEHAHALPDPADAHVLAAAIAAGADILLTFNLRDFPARSLAAHGLAARHPDGFLWELFSGAPEVLDAAIREAAPGDPEAPAAPDDTRRALKRAQLPRLAKAWRAWRHDPTRI